MSSREQRDGGSAHHAGGWRRFSGGQSGAAARWCGNSRLHEGQKKFISSPFEPGAPAPSGLFLFLAEWPPRDEMPGAPAREARLTRVGERSDTLRRRDFFFLFLGFAEN